MFCLIKNKDTGLRALVSTDKYMFATVFRRKKIDDLFYDQTVEFVLI